MEPSTLYGDRRQKPHQIWILITLVAGALGALSAVAAGGRGTYDVEPFTVELRARPAPLGKTEISIQPTQAALARLVPRSRAEAGTHASPILLRATVTGLTSPSRIAASDREILRSPVEAATFLGQDGRDAAQRFAMKLALLALGGGAAAGAVIGLRRFRRVVGAAIAGLVTFAVIGLLVQQTYDKSEFSKTRFVSERNGEAPGLDLPTP